MSTRDGFPDLWGITEIAEYADQVAIEAGDPPGFADKRVTTQRVNGWIRTGDWPSPVAELAMGAVYLAKEVTPFVETHLEKARTQALLSQGLPTELRERILAARGKMTMAAAAQQFGVTYRQVRRIWTGA